MMHKSGRLLITFGLGVGLTLALLCVAEGSAELAAAAPASAPQQVSVGRALADGSPIHYVAITGTDSGDCGSPAGACLTVQYAVDQAGVGDEVRVAAGTYTGVTARGGATQVVYISKTVTVRGGYTTTNGFAGPPDPVANPTTLDAQGLGRVLYVTGASTDFAADGLRITGGNTAGEASAHGGGVYAGGNVVMTDCIISGNTTGSDSDGGDGGGVYVRMFRDTTLNGCTVSGNTAGVGDDGASAGDGGDGGGIFNGGSLTIVDSIVSGNTAGDGGDGASPGDGGDGGGILNEDTLSLIHI